MLGQLLRFSAALAANSAELEHLEGMRQRLQNLVEEAQEIAQEQAALTASKQTASKRFQELLSEGLRSATGLERMLLEFYGPGAEKLVEFGIQPLRNRRRARATPEQPEEPGPVIEAAKPEELEDQTI
jgi:DNA repair exonuclease SbcCD ATPase subunit